MQPTTSEHNVNPSPEISPRLFCARCRALDIGQNYEEITKYKHGKVLATLDDVETLLSSACQLCQFIGVVSKTNGMIEAYRDSPDMNPSRIELRAITTENLYLPDEDVSSIVARIKKQRQVIFCLVPHDEDDLVVTPGNHWLAVGIITPESSPISSSKVKKGLMLQPRRVLSDRIPYGLLTKWMGNCERKHGEDCASRAFEDAPCVRVIDCNTLRIIETPPRCDYIALSYVWGSSQARGPGPVFDSANSGILKMPEEMALVVTDAIKVVLRLGH